MRELTLKELQSFCLDILIDVHNFCVKNNIKYSLAYGTLIGAIRHKGFIPWDDDVDIIMPRPDYERFCTIYKSKLYHVSSFEIDSECRMTFGRVYDDDYTVVKSLVPWHKKEHGAWIDIFPIDSAEDVFEKYKERITEILKPFKREQFHRRALARFSYNYSIRINAFLFLKKLLLFNGVLVPHFIKQVIQKSKALDFGSTNHWGMTVYIDSYGFKDYHDNSLFDEVIDVEFENHMLKSLKGYDEYLRQLYGDYMLLPPEVDRAPRQTYIHVFWKQTHE